MSKPVPHAEEMRSPTTNVHSVPSAAPILEARGPVPFRSILFDEAEISTVVDGREAPECFTDLNLDQIVASITAGREEYNLKPFFYTPLRRTETINYRHDTLRDLENQAIGAHPFVRPTDAGDARASRSGRQTLLQVPKRALVPGSRGHLLQCHWLFDPQFGTLGATVARIAGAAGILDVLHEVGGLYVAIGRNTEAKGQSRYRQILPPHQGEAASR